MEQFQLGNTGLDPLIRTANDRVVGRFGHLNKLVNAITALQETPPGSGITSVQPGSYIDIDDSDAANPIINNTGVQTVTGTAVDNTDSKNPIININVESGTWTPTFSDFFGCVVGVTPINAYYSRVDNIVTATILASADLDFSLGSGFGYTEFDLPVGTAAGNIIGLGQLFQNSVNCNIASDNLKIRFYSTSSSDIGIVGFTFTFQYEVN